MKGALTEVSDFILPLLVLEKWLETSQEGFGHLAKALILKALEKMLALSEEVDKYIPKYKHIANNTQFNICLCQKKGLESPNRDKLNEKSMEFFRSIRDLSRLHAGWGLKPQIDEDGLYEDVLGKCTSVWEKARDVVSVVATVKLIVELKGDEQKEAARKLLGKPSLANVMAEVKKYAPTEPKDAWSKLV